LEHAVHYRNHAPAPSTAESSWDRALLEGLVQDKLESSGVELSRAHAHETRLRRIWESQTDRSKSKKECIQVMSFFWGMEETQVHNCINFRVCIEESVGWVRGLEDASNSHNTDTFPASLMVCFVCAPHNSSDSFRASHV
jgi:hypothetical protein